MKSIDRLIKDQLINIVHLTLLNVSIVKARAQQNKIDEVLKSITTSFEWRAQRRKLQQSPQGVKIINNRESLIQSMEKIDIIKELDYLNLILLIMEKTKEDKENDFLSFEGNLGIIRSLMYIFRLSDAKISDRNYPDAVVTPLEIQNILNEIVDKDQLAWVSFLHSRIVADHFEQKNAFIFAIQLAKLSKNKEELFNWIILNLSRIHGKMYGLDNISRSFVSLLNTLTKFLDEITKSGQAERISNILSINELDILKPFSIIGTFYTPQEIKLDDLYNIVKHSFEDLKRRTIQVIDDFEDMEITLFNTLQFSTFSDKISHISQIREFIQNL